MRKTNKKKTPEAIKKELQESNLEGLVEENANLNEEENLTLFVCNSPKIIIIVGKKGELLKIFEEEDEFFNNVGLNRSNIYFKMRLFKFLCKFPVLKNSTLTPSYFKSNMKLIKKDV